MAEHWPDLAPGRYNCNSKSAILKLIWQIDILWTCSYENAIRPHWW